MNCYRKVSSFLGHVVTPEGVHCDPKNKQALRDWPVPHNVTEVRSNLGLASYYRQFIPAFVVIASALIALTGVYVKFQWTKACQDSFQQLRELLVSSLVLAYPKKEGQFVLDTDAKDMGIGRNQAYSRLSTTHGHIIDCKLDSVVYAGVCV